MTTAQLLLILSILILVVNNFSLIKKLFIKKIDYPHKATLHLSLCSLCCLFSVDSVVSVVFYQRVHKVCTEITESVHNFKLGLHKRIVN
jgi:hypothetical protein